MIKHPLPTGFLIVDDYAKGPLETLSIGDYGKRVNVKADFLGLTDPINGVPNTECMPLSEKWVITLSTQYGCPMKCTFCDVPNVPFKGNVSVEDLYNQLFAAIRCFPEVKYAERLNIHFARMGEPIFNKNVFDFAEQLYSRKRMFQLTDDLRIEVIHPVVSTSMPAGVSALKSRIERWCNIKNELYNGQAGLQFSINSTNEIQRQQMFGGRAMTLVDIAKLAATLPMPVGRKYCLNFAYVSGYEIDAQVLASLFDTEMFMVKITPIHNNNACRDNNLQTINGYDSYSVYAPIEQALIDVGFDVLVFIPSSDEERGLVTCGNAILGGGKLRTTTVIPNIRGL